MKKLLTLLLTFSLVLSFSFVSYCAEDPGIVGEAFYYEPEIFFIDSDFSSDVDDALAISTAIWFEDVGLVDIRGISLCCTSTRAAQAMTALLYSHKKWDILVSMDTSYGIPIANTYLTIQQSFIVRCYLKQKNQ